VSTPTCIGKNLLAEVPQDLYRRTGGTGPPSAAPAGLSTTYRLDFRDQLPRRRLARTATSSRDARTVVGMYTATTSMCTPWIIPGSPNTLAVKVIPERAIQDVDRVELADSWYDWINWRYLGTRVPARPCQRELLRRRPQRGHLQAGPCCGRSVRWTSPPRPSYTDLRLPDTSTARLTLFTTLRNDTDRPVRGVLRATVSRQADRLQIARPVRLDAREQREIRFSPADFPELTVSKPDLWWPYTMGEPALYDLRLDFIQGTAAITTRGPAVPGDPVRSPGSRDGPDGDFYLPGQRARLPVRGATYTPICCTATTRTATARSCATSRTSD